MRSGLGGLILLAAACMAAPEKPATAPPKPAAPAPVAALQTLAPPSVVVTKRGDGVQAAVNNPNPRRLRLQSRLDSASRFHIEDAAGKLLSSYDVELMLSPEERFLEAGQTRSTSISSLSVRTRSAGAPAQVCYEFSWTDEDKEGVSSRYRTTQACISWPAGDPVPPKTVILGAP